MYWKKGLLRIGEEASMWGFFFVFVDNLRKYDISVL